MTSSIPLSLLSIPSLLSTNLSTHFCLSAYPITPASCLLKGAGSIYHQEDGCSLCNALDTSGIARKISMLSILLLIPLLATCLTSFSVLLCPLPDLYRTYRSIAKLSASQQLDRM